MKALLPTCLLTALLASSISAQQSHSEIQIRVLPVLATSIADKPYFSSTRLICRWERPGLPVAEYRITATDPDGNILLFKAAGDRDSLELTGLRSSTRYEIELAARGGDDQIVRANVASGTTSEEYWQLEGEGSAYPGLARAVPDGNTLPYFLTMPSSDGTVSHLYYHPALRDRNRWDFQVAIAGTNAPGGLSASSRFEPVDGGIKRTFQNRPGENNAAPEGSLTIKAFQPVPLLHSKKIRLFFEAHWDNDQRKRTRIFYLDSHDGFMGTDFHPDRNRLTCGGIGSGDFLPGGPCEPVLAIGLDGDPGRSPSGLAQARQFKIGYPKRTSRFWDEAPGTFMVITGDDACGRERNSLFYAHWTGSEWNVIRDASGCARPLVRGAHGPVIVHLGEGRYKLYYEDQEGSLEPPVALGQFSSPGRSRPGTQRPQGPMRAMPAKPLRVIYADATRTGDSSVIDIGDWDPDTVAREVNFLWPNGDALDAEDESGLGDHVIELSGDDPDREIMYMNIGGFDNAKWKAASSGIGVARLVNP